MHVALYFLKKAANSLINTINDAAPFCLEILFLIFVGWSAAGTFTLLAALVFTLCIFVLQALLLATQNSVFNLFTFVSKVNPANFEHVPTDVWIEGLETDGVIVDQESTQELRHMFSSLKILVAKDNIPTTDYLPMQVVTFPSLVGNWIFVPSRYEKMNGLEKFQLLHEIGHLNVRATLVGMARSSSSVALTSLIALFVFFRVEIGLTGLVIIFSVILLDYIYSKILSLNKLAFQITDEMEADHFAFKHAKAQWFKQYPARSVAERFCRRSGHSKTTQELWIKHFEESLTSLRTGSESLDDCLNRHFPKPRYIYALQLIKLLKASAFLFALSLYQAPTGAQAAALLTVSIVLFVVTSSANAGIKSASGLLLRLFESNSERSEAITYLGKFVSWYTLTSTEYPSLRKMTLDRLRTFCLDQLDAYDDELEANGSDSSGGKQRLFESPDDFDIYCDREKGVNYIFHGPHIANEIDHLEFDLLTRRITVHTKDSGPLDLGTRIRSLVFPELARNQNLHIVRTEQGNAVEGLEVALKIVAK